MAKQTASPELQALLAVGRTLDGEGPVAERLDAALRTIAERFDAAAAGVCQHAVAGSRRELRHVFGQASGTLDQWLASPEDEPCGAILGGRDAVRIPELANASAHLPLLRSELPEGAAALAVALRFHGAEVGVLALLRPGSAGFTGNEEAEAEAIARLLAVWLQNDQLLRELGAELAERRLLLDVSRAVGRTIELDRVLDGVFNAMAGEVPYDAAAIFLTEPDGGNLELVAQRGYDDPSVISSVPEGHGIIGQARQSVHGMLIDDVVGHPDYLEARASTRSEMAVPIVSGGRAIGVVNLESDRPRAYDSRSLRIAELIAAQVSSAIVNARLHASRLERAQVERELQLAREIQLSLLPPASLRAPQIDIAAVNVPSSTIGGDYYDYVLDSSGYAFLVIADVSGHGISAALLTASMRTGFRLLARQTHDPAEIARRLGEALYEGSPRNQYVAAVIAVLHQQTGEVRYCNAGHLPPLAVATDGERRELFGGGVPLGLFPGAIYESRQLQLRPGELLALYTDGIPEAEDDDGNQLGADVLNALLVDRRDAALPDLIQLVRERVRAHRGRRGGHLDDVTLLTARWRGPDGAAG